MVELNKQTVLGAQDKASDLTTKPRHLNKVERPFCEVAVNFLIRNALN